MRTAAFLTMALLACTAHAQGKYTAQVSKAKIAVVQDFKDPDSAKFRNLGIYRSTTGKGGMSVCGEVNAKNAYGGYVGFRKFVVSDDLVELEEADGGGTYSVLGPALCHELVTRVK